jgi:adenylate cyclase
MVMAGLTQCVVYRFGSFALDLMRGALLSRGDAEIPLRPKSFALLQFLVEHAGRLVPREAIMEALWPNTFVADDNISQCIHDIRQALGTEAHSLLRTLPRRGYIFTAEVAIEQLPARSASLPGKDSTDALSIVGVGRTPPVDTAMAAERRWPEAPVDLLSVNRPSIAVLAFDNLSNDPSQEYLSDGVADDIITELSRNRSLFVVARTSSFTYKDRSLDVKQIARQLGVRYIVDGSVRRNDRKVRITAQLIDAETAGHIWIERFDRDLADLFAVQDQVTRAMVAAIDPAISQTERRRAMQKPPENLSAWEAWQRALWHWSQGGALSTRRHFLQLAVVLDPHFAPAHAMLAWLYLSESTRGLGRPLQEIVELAEAEARTAHDLDPDCAIAHAAMAWVLDHQGDCGAALEEAETAIVLNPNSPHGYLIKGHVLGLSGQPAKAQEPLATALRLDPCGPTAPAVMHNRAVSYYLERDYAAAEGMTRRAITTYPEHPRPYLWRAAALGQLERADEAHSALDTAIATSPGYLEYKTNSRAPYMRPEDHEHLLEGLRKAGWRVVC